MISKQELKLVKSLKLKKYRKKAESFLVEGAKNVEELLCSDFKVKSLFVTQRFIDEFPDAMRHATHFELCSQKELQAIGTFQTNEYAVAVAGIQSPKLDIAKEKLVLALDDVSDPGNLGTIVRIADWYGIKTILASTETADFYNPKVINASMGSFTRVAVHYLDLNTFFEKNASHRVYGAFLHGENVHFTPMQFPAILLMGNESKGISTLLGKAVDHKITIPRYGHAESLNVAISTAIICDNMLRK